MIRAFSAGLFGRRFPGALPQASNEARRWRWYFVVRLHWAVALQGMNPPLAGLAIGTPLHRAMRQVGIGTRRPVSVIRARPPAPAYVFHGTIERCRGVAPTARFNRSLGQRPRLGTKKCLLR